MSDKRRGTNGNGKKPAKPLVDPHISPLVRAVRGVSASHLYHNSYLSRGTIANLLKGKTKRPNHMTMVGIAAANGMEYRLQRKGD